MLTLLPGADYPLEEFGRDLLLLARRPDLRTRDDSGFEPVGSTLGKGAMRKVIVYDESGNQIDFIAIRFQRGR